MLSSEEYNELLPYMAEIKQFPNTGKFKGEGMFVIDKIRQRHGNRPICFACDGDKIEAMKDIYIYVTLYEESVLNLRNG